MYILLFLTSANAILTYTVMSYSEKSYASWKEKKKYVYITGDFNCNTLVSNTSTEELKNILSANHFYPLINRPTRFAKCSATLIDNIYCNMPNIYNYMAAGLLHANISDHKGIFCIDNNTLLSKKQYFDI